MRDKENIPPRRGRLLLYNISRVWKNQRNQIDLWLCTTAGTSLPPNSVAIRLVDYFIFLSSTSTEFLHTELVHRQHKIINCFIIIVEDGKNVANSPVYGTVLCGFHGVIVLVNSQQIKQCYSPDEFSLTIIDFHSNQLIFNKTNNIYKYKTYVQYMR